MEHILDDSFARHVNAWCGLHGLMYTDGATNWYPAPISLVPSPFSKSAFDYAQAVQPIWHKLMDRIARDRPFLLRELAVVGDADDFTNRLIQLYQSIPAEVLAEGLQFGIFRSDYMLNHDSRLLQVEINTIAASFGCLSKKVRSLHDHLLHRFEDSEAYRGLLGAVLPSQPQGEPQAAAALRQSLQDNYSLENLASSIAAAHRVFDEASAVVLFVVQPAERNVSPSPIPSYMPHTCTVLTISIPASGPARSGERAVGEACDQSGLPDASAGQRGLRGGPQQRAAVRDQGLLRAPCVGGVLSRGVYAE